MRSLIQRGMLALGAVIGLLGSRPATANAQKALVYCPVTVDATGCNAIVSALTGPAYPLGVDRGYDGTAGTVDLETVDLFAYSVFVVPSLADDATSQPYTKLRDPEVVEHLKAALIGRIAMWSGTPDQGATNRSMKDALIQNLAGYAGGAFGTAKGPGLVALLDMSSNTSSRYDWVRAITPVPVTSDAALLIYNSVRALNQRATSILTSGAGPIVYDNMATFGLQVPNGAPGVMLDALGQTGTTQGGQVVLLTMEAGNTSGAIVKTDRDDYAPGETVRISGTGWQAGEQVKLSLHMDPLRDSDTELTATADGAGNFTNTEFSPATYDVGVRFVLTALGQSSGRRSQTTFTDGNKISFSDTRLGNEASSFGPVTLGSCTTVWVQERQGGNFDSTRVAARAVTLGTSPSGITFHSNNTCGGGPNQITSVVIAANQPAAQFWFKVNTGAGPFTIGGDGGFGGNNNASATVTVGAAAVATSLALSAPSPASVPFGSAGPVTFSATLTTSPGGTPVGGATVAFTVDGSPVGSATTNGSGVATVSTYNPSGLSVNPHNVQASFVGATITGTTYNASTSGTQTLTVTQASTSTTLTSSPNPSSFGQSVTFTATVSVVAPGGGTPTGNVDFKEGATTIGSGTLSTVGGVQQATFSTTTLTVATHNVTATYVGSTNFATSTSGSVAQVVNPIATTLTADPATGTYGGTVTLKATLKNGSTPVSGKTVSFTLNGTASGTATTDASGVATLPNVSLTGIPAGTYNPGASSGVRADFASDGTFAASSGTATVKVDPKALTITANDQAKSYGAAVTFAGTEFSTGAGQLVAGDVVTSVTLTSTGAVATALVAGSPYDITPSAAVGTGLTNYTISYAAGKLTVNTRALTITATDRTKTYGDAVTFAGTEFTTGAGQLVNGDGVTSVTLTSAGAATTALVAGSPYAITASAAVGTGLANYAISYTGGKLKVDPRTLTITANDRSKTYGDAVTFAGTEFTAGSGQLVNGDAVTTVTLASAGAAATALVAGSPYAIVASNAAGTGLANYTIGYVDGKLTVGFRALTITAKDVTKTYGDVAVLDGTSGFTTAPGQLANSDVVTSVTLASPGAAATALVAGSPYDITASNAVGTGLTNYSITYAIGKLKVDPKALTITASNRTKTYGDAVTFAGDEFTTSGLVNSDAVNSVTLTSGGSATTALVAGSPYAIVASNAVGTGLTNYTIGYVDGKLTVTARALTITAKDASKTYGDIAVLDGTTGFTTGAGELVNGDAVSSVTLMSAGAAATAIVSGSPYAIIASAAVGSGLANYSIGYTAGKLTVDPRTLTITAKDASKTYGQVAALNSATGFTTGAGQLVNTDAVNSVTLTSAGTPATAPVSPGSPYDITPSAAVGTGLANYTIGYANGKLTVNKATLTVKADDKSRVFGAPNPTLTATFTGFVNSEVLATSGVTGAPSLTTTAIQTSPVVAGGYPITAAIGTLAAANYQFTFANGTLTVNQAATIVSLTNQTLSEGVTSISLTANVSAASPSTATVNEGTVTFTIKRGATVVGTIPGTVVNGVANATYPTSAGGPLQPDTYTIDVKYNGSTNFLDCTTNATATIVNGVLKITGATSAKDPVAINTPTTISGTFTDPGLGNGTYTVKFDLSVLGSFTCTTTVPQSGCSITAPTSGGPGTFTLTKTFPTASVNLVKVTVNDQFGAQDAVTQADYLVLYDASGGFVTGGGWIDSPQGACLRAPCTQATVGKANFGFVSKYKKGQSTPDGNTEFQFKAGDINFHSEDYEWLVVAGAKAQFKGTGTINGSGNYGFILTAVDGQISGGGGTDKFRIKIWDKNNSDAVVYDNQLLVPDDATPTTILGGGSINIQTK